MDTVHLPQSICIQHFLTTFFQEPELPAGELGQIVY